MWISPKKYRGETDFRIRCFESIKPTEKDQVTPDLQHGRWVMIGKATKLNYFAAGCPAGLFKHDNYITGYVEIERLKGVPYLYKTDKGWSADIPFLKHDLFNQWTLR